MALADEEAWFRDNRSVIASRYAGKYVLVKDRAVQGAYPSFDQAYKAGAARFGANSGFLIKQALPQEPQAII